MRIESRGASGYYAELIGVVVLGKYCPELQEQFEVAAKAQELAMDLCKPGDRANGHLGTLQCLFEKREST